MVTATDRVQYQYREPEYQHPARVSFPEQDADTPLVYAGLRLRNPGLTIRHHQRDDEGRVGDLHFLQGANTTERVFVRGH